MAKWQFAKLIKNATKLDMVSQTSDIELHPSFQHQTVFIAIQSMDVSEWDGSVLMRLHLGILEQKTIISNVEGVVVVEVGFFVLVGDEVGILFDQ